MESFRSWNNLFESPLVVCAISKCLRKNTAISGAQFDCTFKAMAESSAHGAIWSIL